VRRPATVLLPHLRDQIKDAPSFIRDAAIDINLRSFDRSKLNLDQTRSEAWAGGASIAVRSGWLADTLSLGSVFYTSQPIYAPLDRDGTGLLAFGQQPYSVLGQAYARLKFMDEHFVTLGRQAYNSPYINAGDGKMSPNTFQGYILQGTLESGGGLPNLGYVAGHISEMRVSNSQQFVSMSRVAGADVDRGVTFAGAQLAAGDISIGAINYYCPDVINISYSEMKYSMRLPGGLDGQLAAQYIDQRSVGSDLLTGSPFLANAFGARFEAGRDGAILTLAYSVVSAATGLQDPWSKNPMYTNTMVSGFKKPGEQAIVARLAYDFDGVGLEGVTAYVRYGRGWTSAAAAGAPLTEDEVDFNIEWRPQWQALKGVRLHARYGSLVVDQDGKTRSHDFRLIANYDFSLF
jgi:hypothetical protein